MILLAATFEKYRRGRGASQCTTAWLDNQYSTSDRSCTVQVKSHSTAAHLSHTMLGSAACEECLTSRVYSLPRGIEASGSWGGSKGAAQTGPAGAHADMCYSCCCCYCFHLGEPGDPCCGT